MGFEFDTLGAWGPASNELGDAAYRLSGEDGGVYGAAEPSSLPGSFRGGEFMELVAGRGRAWLDAATTMLDINIDHRKSLGDVKGMALSETQCDPAIVDDAFNELVGRGMLLVDGRSQVSHCAAPAPLEAHRIRQSQDCGSTFCRWL